MITHPPQVYDIVRGPAVARHGDVTGLGVQGEELQVHGAAQGQGDLQKCSIFAAFINKLKTLTYFN